MVTEKTLCVLSFSFFFFQAEDGIRDLTVTGVQTCALPICSTGRDPKTQACTGKADARLPALRVEAGSSAVRLRRRRRARARQLLARRLLALTAAGVIAPALAGPPFAGSPDRIAAGAKVAGAHSV